MKVYTEVNYEWKNDSLVQTSSESFDYSGDIALCGGGGGGGGVTKVLNKVIKDPVEGVMNTVADPAGTIAGGPKGTLGDITDKLYGGTTQDLIEGAQGKTEEDAVAPPVLSAEEVDPQAALTAQNQKRKQEQGRGAANLTAGQSATMLTS